MTEGSVLHDGALLGATGRVEGETKIDSGAGVYGMLHSAYPLDLRGAVHGFTYTQQFRTRTAGSVYAHHLLDARLAREDLASTFAQGILQPNVRTYRLIEPLQE